MLFLQTLVSLKVIKLILMLRDTNRVVGERR